MDWHAKAEGKLAMAPVGPACHGQAWARLTSTAAVTVCMRGMPW